MTVLFTGGSGCGKSTYAEKVLGALPELNRYYIATMKIVDEESQKRVDRHVNQRRHLNCVTIERSKNIDSACIPQGAVVLLEDLPNLLAGEMFDGGDIQRIVPQIKALAEKCSHLLIVTNDVFSDGESYDPYTMDYMKELAKINNAVAEFCDCVTEVVYSIPVFIKGSL